MVGWGRDTPWRQGHVLSADAAEAIGLAEKEVTNALIVVISHDCDLAQEVDVEPVVEVIVGERISALEGQYVHAKNARRLHLIFSIGATQVAVNLNFSKKRLVDKIKLAEFEPNAAVTLTTEGRDILQRWLAARYRRSAFPDEFDRRLERTKIREKMGKILNSAGDFIKAVFFDLDQGAEHDRKGPDDIYLLSIFLLYSTDLDATQAESVSSSAKAKIEAIFKKTLYSDETKKWTEIELEGCEIISDEVMTVKFAETLKRWRADHISLKAKPSQPMLREE